MKILKVILLLSFFTAGFAQEKPDNTPIVLRKSVLGAGGIEFNDGEYRIVGTLGQPFVSSESNPVGFWYQVSRELNVELEQDNLNVPKEFQLQQNYPNPFNPTTTIEFALPKKSTVTLQLFDILGREIATLVDAELESGVHKINFDAQDLASGIYFYRIHAEGFLKTKKLMLLK